MLMALALIQADLDSLARRLQPSGGSGAAEGLTLTLMWLGSRLGIAGRWALGAGLLALGAAVALLAAWRHRGKSADFELNRQQWSGQTGCLGFLGLFGGLFVAQTLSGILADSGAGLAAPDRAGGGVRPGPVARDARLDPARFETALALLDSRLVVVREDKRPGSERPGSGQRVHLSFQGEQAILHHLAHLGEMAQRG